MCGIREPAHGVSTRAPLGIQSNSAQVKKWFRGLRSSHRCRHEVCPEDSERNQNSRHMVRRAARGMMQFEHTADEIVCWLKEAVIENSKFTPSDVTSSEVEISKSCSERGDGFQKCKVRKWSQVSRRITSRTSWIRT